MSSIDWYLNWPHLTFISWDKVHLLVLGDLGIEGFCYFFLINKTLISFLDQSTPKNTNPAKNLRFNPSFLYSGPSKVENNRLKMLNYRI
jgi:hypothetical protein